MKKQQDNYKTPNEKFDAEFAEENTTQKNPSKIQDSYKTPNEKFNAEFENKNSSN